MKYFVNNFISYYTCRLLFFLVFVCFCIIPGCAKIGQPIGGPKDITPPEVVNSNPPAGSTEFKGKRVEITFNEFVQLNDINKYFVASPPLQKKPMILLRGKSVQVNLEEQLMDSSTYRFYFGDAIVDLNEKNILKNFEFVFSTGKEIDSLSLRGRVINAFDYKPSKESFYVMLYNKFPDSIPRKTLPQYITKTDENGWFSITHIKPDTFMILALKDLNQNYLFDLPNEPIAFSDTLITINQNYFIPDSLVKPDTTSTDTTNWSPFKSQIQLFSFNEFHEKQYIKRTERNKPEKFGIVFNLPVNDSMSVKPINFDKKDWYIPDYPIAKKDSMEFWLTDTSLVFKDTLQVQLAYTMTDSLNKPFTKIDTIKLINKKPPVTRKQVARTRLSPFSITTNLEGSSTLDLNKRFVLISSHPLANMDIPKIKLTKIQDDKRTPLKFQLTRDSVLLRHYYLDFKLEPQTEYELVADSTAFTSIYGQMSDSVGFKFASQKDDYYGDIKMNISSVKQPMIIQLMLNGKIVEEKFIDKDQIIHFTFLKPDKYKVKAVYDRNANKVWDTGNFAEKLQPEKVTFYNKEFQVRSNWSIEEEWKLE